MQTTDLEGTDMAGDTVAVNSDEYNGWTNRETWAVNLWLTNDQGLDAGTRETIEVNMIAGRELFDRDMAGLDLKAPVRTYAADAVRHFVEELLDPNEGLLDETTRHSMASDCGSLWRVNWYEIADAFREA
jgi:hypothetical protein